ncbi:uncharacterized protein LOC134267244 [Saccostrea cucullata]|uniref:uncharacterized protein LOC134267244 n=1 Tax=Saccostrea cuccullata TaxID=36930 RepID=UPI002ED00BD6
MRKKRTNVLVIGHSFVTRLEQLLGRSDAFQADFNLAQCEIRCFGFSGGRVENLLKNQDLQHYITSFKPVVIILQIGGNDICSVSARPETVACNISELMETMGKFDCVQVDVVCELFIRTRPRNISPQMYEEKRNIINNMLPVLLEGRHNKKFMFWLHLRLMNSPLHILSSDGLHIAVYVVHICHCTCHLTREIGEQQRCPLGSRPNGGGNKYPRSRERLNTQKRMRRCNPLLQQ